MEAALLETRAPETESRPSLSDSSTATEALITSEASTDALVEDRDSTTCSFAQSSKTYQPSFFEYYLAEINKYHDRFSSRQDRITIRVSLTTILTIDLFLLY